MENLNEVITTKYVIAKDGIPVIKTDSIDMANAKWKPEEGGHWTYERNGQVIKEEKND